MQFPTLNSGAVAQYGARTGSVWPAQVIRFVDGEDQRFLASGRPLRRWLIDLRLLNESEIAAMEAFFSSMSGEFLTFNFPDPVGGSVVPNCRIGGADLTSVYQGVDIAATSFWVVETNG